MRPSLIEYSRRWTTSSSWSRTPQQKSIYQGVSLTERVDIDRRAILDTLTSDGFKYRTDIDLPARLTTISSKGPDINAASWSFDVWDFYQRDYQSARTDQEERERQALESLEPLRVALEKMAEDG